MALFCKREDDQDDLDLPDFAFRGHDPPRSDSHPECSPCKQDTNTVLEWAGRLEVQLRKIQETMEKVMADAAHSIEVAAQAQRGGQDLGLVHILNHIERQQLSLFHQLDTLYDKVTEIQREIRDQKLEFTSNEVICYCGRQKFGNVISCDNPECAFISFHWGCVGITASPQTGETWYCPDCSKRSRKIRATRPISQE